MKRIREPTPEWVVDYSAARAHAIRWLGDRYLLARPINEKRYSWHGETAALLASMPAQAPLASTPPGEH
jgi:hypothetical protein